MLLQIGSQGIAVGVVQQKLRDLGFDITADCTYGPITAHAVRSFQAQAGIAVDGIVGPETLRALGLETALLQATLDAWRQLTSFRPPLEIQRLVRDKGVNWYVHRIEQGCGDINLDFYPVRINQLPVIDGKEITAENLLLAVRRSFNQFIDTSIAELEPYDLEDEPLWMGGNPAGAVLHIGINAPGLTVHKGAVVVAHATPSNWIFSTIWTVDDLNHPVSGNRQFGFLEQDNDSTIFYTRSADRITGSAPAPQAGLIFDTADKLWRSLQRGVARYVNQNDGQAQVLPQAAVSQRLDWNIFGRELHHPKIKWLP